MHRLQRLKHTVHCKCSGNATSFSAILSCFVFRIYSQRRHISTVYNWQLLRAGTVTYDCLQLLATDKQQPIEVRRILMIVTTATAVSFYLNGQIPTSIRSCLVINCLFRTIWSDWLSYRSHIMLKLFNNFLLLKNLITIYTLLFNDFYY